MAMSKEELVEYKHNWWLKNKKRLQPIMCAYHKEYAKKNKLILFLKNRKYYLENKKDFDERRKKYVSKNRLKVNEYHKKHALRNKTKIKARNKARCFEKKKCAFCGSKNKLNRHHINYKKNLVVVLCSSCHGKQHRKDIISLRGN